MIQVYSIALICIQENYDGSRTDTLKCVWVWSKCRFLTSLERPLWWRSFQFFHAFLFYYHSHCKPHSPHRFCEEVVKLISEPRFKDTGCLSGEVAIYLCASFLFVTCQISWIVDLNFSSWKYLAFIFFICKTLYRLWIHNSHEFTWRKQTNQHYRNITVNYY